ncbi:hypothetical protein NL676_011257 [Syzygium grande]|nr:hypothetical protein NL676_011257 [Syzygium grande]
MRVFRCLATHQDLSSSRLTNASPGFVAIARVYDSADDLTEVEILALTRFYLELGESQPLILAIAEAQVCRPSGRLQRTHGKGNTNYGANCCKRGELYKSCKYNNGKRCHKEITINGNGRSVKAKVVDECNLTMGCDKDHDFQPPCLNNIVDASKAVWEALGVPKSDCGEMEIFWSED